MRKHSPPPALRIKWWGWILLVVCSAVLVALLDQWQTRTGMRITLWWILGPFVVIMVACIAYFVAIHEGLLTWRRTALAPMRAFLRGEHEKADTLFQEVLAQARSRPANDRIGAVQITVLADFLAVTGRFPESRPLYEEALKTLALHLEKWPTDYLTCLNNLAVRLIAWREWPSARGYLEQAVMLIQPFNWDKRMQSIMALFHTNLAVVYLHFEEWERAEDALRDTERALPLASRFYRPMFAAHLAANRCRLHVACKNLDAAEKELARIPEAMRKMFQAIRGELLLERGKFAEAETALREQLVHNGKDTPDDHPSNMFTLQLLESALIEQQKWPEAKETLERLFEISRKNRLPATSEWQRDVAKWARSYRAAGDTDTAARLDRETAAAGPASTHIKPAS